MPRDAALTLTLIVFIVLAIASGLLFVRGYSARSQALLRGRRSL